MERTALGVEAEMKSAVAEGDYARAGEIGSAAGLSPDLIPVVIGNLLIELRQQEKALSFLSGSQLMREAEAEIQAEGEPASSPLEEPSLEEPSNVDDILGVWNSSDPPKENVAAKVVATLIEARKVEPDEEAKGGALAVIPELPLASWDGVAEFAAGAEGQLLEAMNARHAIIDSVGGETAIASWEASSRDPEKHELKTGSKTSLLLRYSNLKLYRYDAHGNRGIVTLAQWWLDHRGRQQYRAIIFRPGGPRSVSRCLNLWQGWGVEAKPGDWSLIRNHIEVVIADGNAEYAEYIIRWIAWAIQNPSRRAEVALVLIGRKGIGKGTLVRCLERIFGAHTFQVTSKDEVVGRFNGHLQDCILFVADEAYWGGDKRCVGRLQGMITEPTLAIERKGIDIYSSPNCLHIVMLAEPGWVIPAGKFERRYAAFAVSGVMRGKKEYFRALYNQIEGDGAAAMFYDLSRLELGDWHPREIDPVRTSAALQDQQIRSLPPLEQWYFLLLQDGVIPDALGKRPNTAYTFSLMNDIKERIPRLKFDLTEVMLRNFLIDDDTLGIACTKYRSSTGNGWSFPPLSSCREAWEVRYGTVAWDPDVVEWKQKQKSTE